MDPGDWFIVFAKAMARGPGRWLLAFMSSVFAKLAFHEENSMNKAILLAALAVFALPAAAHAMSGDVAKGEKVFRKCMGCHYIKKDKNKVGPTLQNVVGRPAASVKGYNYSAALKAKGKAGLVWTEDNLDKWLTSPRKFVPGTKMTFFGLHKASQRADVIAYLKSMSKPQ